MTISNLNVATPSGTDTLYLDDTGATALHILNSLIIGISFNSFGDEDPGGGALISSNSTLIVDGLLGGQLVDDGTMVFTGGSLITTNCSLQVGTAFAGLLIISNGIVQARDVAVVAGESTIGTIEAVGGTMTLSSSLTVGADTPNSQDSFLVANGGLLVVTNGETFMGGSHSGGGTMTVSNATFLAADVGLGGVESGGALVIDNGTVSLSGQLGIGFGDTCGGSVSLSGGILVVTNNTTTIGGDQCDGELTVEDGLFVAREIFVGTGIFASGVLTINGGTTQLSSNLQIGTFGGLNFGSVVVNGGQLVVTNSEIMVERGASITVSGGLLAAKYIDLDANFVAAALSVNGGSVTVSTGITLGDCAGNTLGHVSVDGGQLTVTNAAHTGFIDVQNGQLVLSNGVLQVDRLVMTNTCSQFVHTGGTLIVGSVVLDPNAFAITSVAREGNNLRVTWLMAPGQTNALQVSSGGPHGGYTNNFTDIFLVTNNTTAGTLTNYLDIGAATNKPSRYYRARFSP